MIDAFVKGFLGTACDPGSWEILGCLTFVVFLGISGMLIINTIVWWTGWLIDKLRGRHG